MTNTVGMCTSNIYFPARMVEGTLTTALYVQYINLYIGTALLYLPSSSDTCVLLLLFYMREAKLQHRARAILDKHERG